MSLPTSVSIFARIRIHITLPPQQLLLTVTFQTEQYSTQDAVDEAAILSAVFELDVQRIHEHRSDYICG
jgi:hypothetical protein